MRFTIGVRIGMGFGLFGLAVGALFLLTRSTLVESRELGRQIDEVLAPSLEALEGVDRSLAETRVLIQHWLTVQSRADSPEKMKLVQLLEEELPVQWRTVAGLSPDWQATAQLQVDSLEEDLEHLFLVYGEIMRLLPSFQSYNDPLASMEAQYYALDGSSLPQFNASIRRRIDFLRAAQTSALGASTSRMEGLGDRLQFYAGNVAGGVLILGFLIAFLVTRSIVRPVQDLKRNLLYMGRGVPPEENVPVTSDEIGEMAVALNRLSEGLQRTRTFTLDVGRGDFEVKYDPLSEEDQLGHALLKMRDDLASHERELEGRVSSRTAEVESQKSQIEELYGDLRDSINYAERIQNAILPNPSERRRVFDQAAVFYRPRDVVSGDFYWFHAVGRYRMFSAIDCTGHGVPGAFMSLIGYNALERITKAYTQPDKILDQLNRSAREVLHESGNAEHLNDGMDLAMVAIDQERMRLQYAGAHMPLYIVRGTELFELKPDKFAIASFDPEGKSYTGQEFDLEKGDVIFASTDGFVDQFGGPKGKKFMRKRFRELLKEVASEPVHLMQEALEKTFDDWLGEEDQVDDVLVIGVRV